MKGLKDFRRSLNKDRTSGGKPGATPTTAPGTFTNVKNAVSIQPPKMVIKAITDYRARAPQELSFSKGDFFHVTTDPAPGADWFEACNPISNARGLVPASSFEVLSKSARPGQNGANLIPAGQQTPAQRAAGAAITAKGGGGLFATVQYDFDAEREDELAAKAGETIIVIAQSNFEWFVAKPIGRLGGPGLIPVAFVQIKDLATGQVVENAEELISSGVIPKVEEWKKMTADYKKNTIPLGRFDFPNHAAESGAGEMAALEAGGSQQAWGQSSSSRSDMQDGWDQQQQQPQAMTDPSQEQQAMELPAGMNPGEPLPAGIITQATVDSFHYEQGDYWFRLQASHVAGGSAHIPASAPRAADGEERDLILYRLYEDFYEFQIALLDHFPAEAGRQVDENGEQSQRILPLMPGPLDKVDDYITAQRRGDLDQYISELCALPEYILRSELVRLFFEPRPGDHCTTHPLQSIPASQSSSQSSTKAGGKQRMRESGSDAYGYGSGGGATPASGSLGALDAVEEVRTPNAKQSNQASFSNGTSKYAEDQPVGIHARNASLGHKAQGELANKMDSMSMGTRSSGQSSGNTASHKRNSSAVTSPTNGSLPTPHTYMSRNPSATTVQTQDSRGSGGGQTDQRSSIGNANGVSHASSAAAPSFIKIKIFHRANDDLVAIRVPPSVTHLQLMEKVRDRLGSDIQVLRYRDANPEPGASGMVRMHDDEDLREWLASGAKLNLYADRT